ncbi:serpin family protein [Oscillatoria sp. FACHB-1406]|uniref:serpin family protein n=1 Tax=Oscillatoria sp. FACHB-1406 TaxID=2692846 RepID=UPI0018F0431B|nr:serpin family protein [Oscillatoria sp. FACHB-1406]
MINPKILATAIGTLLLLLGCSFAQQPKTMASDPIVPSAQTLQTPEIADERLLEANAKFGLNLFRQLQQKDTGKNIFISPTSVANALSLLLQGTAGETQQEMLKALELRDMTLTDINRANQTLHQLLENADPSVRVAIANSIWMRQGVAFKPEFLQTNREYYNSEVSELDFSSADAAPRINRWVSDKTNNKIDKMVDSIDPQQVLFLLNAIYFKGDWSQKFDRAQTQEKPFFLNREQTVKDSDRKASVPVAMMSQTGEYRYLENEQFQAVSLPYGKEGRMSFYVFLPKSNSSLESFYQQLTLVNWQTWMQRFSRRDGKIELPRFKLEYETQLKEVLETLGLKTIFDPNTANFSKMTDASVVVDRVKHKSFVEVNEEGTEAAAATSIGIRVTSMPPPPFQMTVDRPFFFAIRDNRSGEVLFMGSMLEPPSP